MFNPHADINNKNLRLFQKAVSGLGVKGGHRLFAMDFIGGSGGSGGFNAGNFAHWPAKGWDVLFTDGAVRFCKSPVAYNYVANLTASPDNLAPSLYEPNILLPLEAADIR